MTNSYRSTRAIASGVKSGPARLSRGVLTPVLLMALFLAPVASAATFVWNGAGADDNFTTGANWGGAGSTTAGTAPTGVSTDALQFGGTTRLTPNNNLAAGKVFGSISFIAGAGSFTIGGNAFILNPAGSVINSSTNAQTITPAVSLGTGVVGTFTLTNTTAGAGALTFSGAVAGGTGGTAGIITLSITGAAPVTINGNVTKGGGTSIILTNTNTSTLSLPGAASSLTTLNMNGAGSILNLGSTGNLTLANAGNNNLQSTTGCTINGTTGSALILGASDDNMGTANGTTMTINCKVTASPITNRLESFVATGNTGTIVLTNPANDFSGGLLISAGTVSVPSIGNSGVAGPMGSGTTITFGSNTTSTFRYTGTGENTNRIISMGISGNIDASGTGSLIFTQNLVSTGTVTTNFIGTGLAEFAGNIANGTGVVSIAKAGTGTWTLSGAANTFSGSTTISAGTLALASGAVRIPATSSLTFGGTSTLDMGGTPLTFTSVTVNDVALTATLANSTVASPITTPLISFPGTGAAITSTLTGGAINIIPSTGLTIDGSSFTTQGNTSRTKQIDSTIIGNGVLTVKSYGDTSDTGGGGPQKLTLTGTNTFTGPIFVTVGFLDFNSNDAVLGNVNNSIILSPSAGLLVRGIATLSATRTVVLSGVGEHYVRTYGSQFLTIPGPVIGSGNIRHTDGGTLALSGTCTYTGTTTNSGGAGSVLQVNGNSLGAPGAVTISPNLILSGNGTVGGPIVLSSPAIITPGVPATPGTLTTQAITMNGASVLNFRLNAGPSLAGGAGLDFIDAGNNPVTLSGTANITTAGGIAAGTYRLIKTSGTITGVLTLGTVPAGFAATLVINPGNGVDLTVQPVTTYTWSGASGTSSNWSDNANWQGGTAPTAATAAGANLVFDATGLQQATSINDLPSGSLFNSISFAGGAYTIAGNAIALANAGNAIAVSGGTTQILNIGISVGLPGATISCATATDVLTLNGTVSDTAFFPAGALTKAGVGLLNLNAANVYTGNTSISAGTIVLGNATALGATTGITTVVSGATLDLNGQTISENLTLAGTGVGALGALINGNAAAATVNGTITNSGSTVGGSNAITLNTVNSNLLTKIGTHTLTLAGNLDNSGMSLAASGGTTVLAKLSGLARAVGSGLTVNSGATVQVAGTGIFQNFTGSAIVVNAGGIIDLNGNVLQCANLSGPGTVTDNASGTGTSQISIVAQTVTTDTLITDGPTRTVSVMLANANFGSTCFTNNGNTYSGGLFLANNATGTRLVVAAGTTTGTPGAIVSGPFGRGPITIGSVPTDKAGIFISVANVTIVNDIIFNTILGTDRPGLRTDGLTGVLSGTIKCNNSSALIGTNGTASITLTGQITSTGPALVGPTGLIIGDTANGVSLTVTLANTGTPNDYTGDTIVQAKAIGVLVLGASNQIPNGAGKGNVNIVTGVTNVHTLNLNGFSETINGLTGTGIVDNIAGATNSILTVGDNNQISTFGGIIKSTAAAGRLGVTKIGTGMLTLSGANTYTGVTSINAGTLSISVLGDGGVASSGIGSATNVASNLVIGGATLQYSGATASSNRNFTLVDGTTAVIEVVTPATVLTMSGASTASTAGLTKIGQGNLTLSGANAYSGATTVSVGTLIKNGVETGVSAHTVASGATLGGSGTLPGTIVAGNINPGAVGAAGTLTSGAVTLNSNSILNYNLNGGPGTGGATLDLIQAGSANVVAAGFLNVTSSGGFAAGSYTLIATSGTVSGTMSVLSMPAGFVGTVTAVPATGLVLTATATTTFTWSGAGADANWSTSGNWVGGVAPTAGTAATADLVFPAAGLQQTTSNNDLPAGTAFNTITLSGGAYTLNGNGITLSNATALNVTLGTPHTLALNLTLASPAAINVASGLTLNIGTATSLVTLGANTLTVNDVGTVNLNSIVSGTGGIIANAAGTLNLTGANLYSGATTVNAGVLTASNNNAFGATSGVTINNTTVAGGNGTIINLPGGITIPSTVSLTMNSTASGNFRSTLQNVAGNNTWAGPITVKGDNLCQFVGAAGIMTVSGNISGPTFTGTLFPRGGGGSHIISGTINIPLGNLSKTDANTWTIASSGNSWINTTVAVGTLALGANNALPPAVNLTMGQNDASNTTLDLAGFNQSVGSLILNTTGGTKTITSSALTPVATFTVNVPTALTYAAPFTGAALALTKTGLGALTLTGANTYGGGTTLSQGSLIAGVATNAFGTNGTITIGDANSGANPLSLFIGITAGTIARPIVVNNIGTGLVTIGTNTGTTASFFTGAIALNRPTTLFALNTDRTTYQGVISGSVGTLTINGTQRTTMEAVNTWVGDVLVRDAGTTFQVGTGTSFSDAVPDGTSIDVAVNTLFRLNTNSEAINALTGAGTVNLNGATFSTLTVGSTGGGGVFAGSIGGLITLVKVGGGTLTLSAPNTHTGNTTVSGGTLALSGTGALTSTPIINVGSGSVFDVSTVAGGFSLGSAQTLISGRTSAFATDINGNTTINGTLDLTGVGLAGTTTVVGNVALNNNARIKFDLSNSLATGNDNLAVTGNLSVNGVVTILPNFVGGPLAAGKYPLLTCTGTLTASPSNFVLALPSGGRQTYAIDTTTVPKTVSLVVTSTAYADIWTGTGTNVWLTGANTNWNNGFDSLFKTMDSVVFNDTSAIGGVTLNSTVIPSLATFNNSTTVYNLTGTGSISGPGSVLKSGTGVATLSTPNTYTGVTYINGGTLNLNAVEIANVSGPLGKQPANGAGSILFGGGTLQYSAGNQADYSGRFATIPNQPISIDTNGQNVTYTGLITGPGSTLTKKGAGTLTLTASNIYSGGSTVAVGTLQLGNGVTNGNAFGNYTINSGATLRYNNATAATPSWVLMSGPGTFDLFSAQAINGTANWGSAALTNAFTGNLFIETGRVDATPAQLGGATSVQVGNGGQLLCFAGTFNQSANLFGQGWGEAGQPGALRVAGNTVATWAGPITLANHAGIYSQGGATFLVSGPVNTNNFYVTATATGTLEFSNVISGSGGLLTAGTSITTLSGANTYTGTTTVSDGTLQLGNGTTGSIAPSSPVAILAAKTMAVNLANNGTLANPIVNAGTLNFNGPNINSLTGQLTGGGTLLQSGTGTTSISNSNNTFSGPITVNGGTLNLGGTHNAVSGLIQVNNSATLNIASTETLNGTNSFVLNNVIAGSAVANVTGTLNLFQAAGSDTLIGQNVVGANSFLNIKNGGTINVTGAGFRLGNSGGVATPAGTLTMDPGSTMYLDTTDAGLGFTISNGAGAAGTSGTVNLDGGLLTTGRIIRTGAGVAGTSTFNFNGGTLRSGVASATFMSGLTRANVRNGGAIIDTNGFADTITQALLHSNIGGDNAVDGGLVKNGTGVLTLAGNNSYTGSSTVNAGKLLLDFSAATVTVSNDMILNTTGLVLGNGALELKGKPAATSSQTFASTTLLAGTSSVITLNTNTANTATLNLGPISQQAGSSADFVLSLSPDINQIQTSTGTANARLGIWATVNGGSDFAAKDATNAYIVPYTGPYVLVDTNAPPGANSQIITNGATSDVKIVTANTGATTPITLGSSTTTVASLIHTGTAAGTLSLAGTNNKLVVGSGAQSIFSMGNAANSLLVGSVAGEGTLTSGTGAAELILSNQHATNLLTINSVLADNGGALKVTKGGLGKVVLAGTNTYTGLTNVAAGVLSVQSAGALGGTAAGTTVANGAALEIQSATAVALGAEPLTLNGTGIANTGALRNILGSNSYGGDITAASATRINSDAGTLTLTGNVAGAGQTLTVGGVGTTVLSGSIGTALGSFVKDGTGFVTLSGTTPNTFAGTTIVDGTLASNVGALQLGKTAGVAAISGPVQMGNFNTAQPNLRMFADNQFAPGVVMSFVNPGQNANYMRFDLQGTNQTLAGLQNVGNNGVVQNERLSGGGTAGPATLTLNGSSAYTFNGYMRDRDGGAGTYLLNIVKNGTGTQSLVGTVISHTGTTTVNAGTLRVSGATAFASPTTVNAGGTLAMNGLNGASISYPATWPVTLNGGTLLTDENGAFVVYSGILNVNADSTINTQGSGATGNNSQLFLEGGLNSPGPRTLTINTSTVNNGVVFRTRTGNFSGALVVNGLGFSPNLRGSVMMADGATLTFGKADVTLNNATWNIGFDSNSDPNTAGNIITAKSLNGNGFVVSESRANSLALGANNGTGTFSGIVGNGVSVGSVLSLVKIGSGTQTLTGNNTYTGSTTVNFGKLQEDYSASGAPASNIINAVSPLILGGGTFELLGKSAASNSQTFASTTLAANTASTVAVTQNGAANTFVDLKAITLNPGATLNFVTSGTAANQIRTSTGTAGTLLGNWATINGTDLAAKDITNVYVVPNLVYANVPSLGGPISNGPASNVKIVNHTNQTGNIQMSSGTTIVNSLVHSATDNASVIDTAGGKTLQLDNASTGTALGHVLLGSGATALSVGALAEDGFLTAGTAGPAQLVLDNQSTTQVLTINAVVKDNGGPGGIVNLVKSGPGTVVLAGTNTYGGLTSVSDGVLSFGNFNSSGTNGSLGNAPLSTNVVLAGGTLQYTGSTATFDRGFTLNPSGILNGGAIEVTNAGALVTLTGVVAGGGALTKAGPGALSLANANTYTGQTFVQGGTLLANYVPGITAINPIPTTNFIDISTGATFKAVSNDSDFTLSNPITGTGTLVIDPHFTTDAGPRQVTMNSTLAAFTGLLDLTPSSALNGFRLATDAVNDLGGATVNVGNGGQVFVTVANLTFPNNITVTGTGYVEAAGRLGAIRAGNPSTFTGAITVNGTAKLGALGGNLISTKTISGGALTFGGSINNTGSETLTIFGDASGLASLTVNDASATSGAANIVVNVGGGANAGTLGAVPIFLQADGFKNAVVRFDRSNGYTLGAGINANSPNVANNVRTFVDLDVLGTGFNTNGMPITLGSTGVGGSFRVGVTRANSVATIDSAVTATNLIVGTLNTGVGTQNANLTLVSGASVNVSSISIANGGGTAPAGNTNGATLNVAAGATLTASTTMFLGDQNSSAGTVNQTGGSVTVGQHIRVAHWPNNTSTYNLSGGTLSITANPGLATNPSNTAESNGGIYLGIDGTGIVNQSGGTLTTDWVVLDNRTDTAGTDTYSLSGGTLAVRGAFGIIRRNPTAAFNFNGGTIQNVGTGVNATIDTPLTLGTGGTGTPTLDTNGAANSFNVLQAMTGTGNLVKTGLGTLNLNTVASPAWTGNLSATGGIVTSNQGSGGLGSFTTAGRTIGVSSGAAINLTVNNMFGNGVANANMPAIVADGGTFFTSRYNAIGNVTLNNGATLSQDTSDAGAFEGYQFVGTVTAGGTSASTISAVNGKANHLGANTVFDVSDVTNSSATDLLVSAPLRDQSGDFGSGAGGLTKQGTGTMALTATNTYTGATVVSAGTLRGTGSVTSAFTVTAKVFPGTAVPATIVGIPDIGADQVMSCASVSFGAASQLQATITSDGSVAHVTRMAAAGLATITSGAKLNLGVSGVNAYPATDIPVLTSAIGGNSIVTSFVLQNALPAGWNVVYLNNGVVALNAGAVAGAPSQAIPGGADTVVIRTLAGGVTPVKIDAFAARTEGAGVLVKWTAVSEYRNAGFNVYRRVLNSTEWVRANPALIAGRISNADEKAYAFYDWAAPGIYEYKLQSVGIAGDLETFYPQTLPVAVEGIEQSDSALALSAEAIDAAYRSTAAESNAQQTADLNRKFASATSIYGQKNSATAADILRSGLSGVGVRNVGNAIVAGAPLAETGVALRSASQAETQSFATAGARWFAPSSLSARTSFTAAKVVYGTPGVLLVPQSELPAGFDAGHVAIQREGRTMTALAVTAEGLVVFGPGYQDDYTDKDALFLRKTAAPTASGQAAQAQNLFGALQQVNTDSPATVTNEYHDVYFDFNLRPYTFAPWFSSQYLTGGTTQSFNIDTPYAAGGAASLTVNLWSLTQSETVHPDHALQVWINGQAVDQAVWSGGGMMLQLTVQVPSGVLLAGSNVVELVTPALNGVDSQIAFLHSMSMNYTRQLNGSKPVDVFNTGASSTVFEVSALPGANAWVVDARYPDRAALVPIQTQMQADGTYTLRFTANTGGTGRYVVVPAGQENRPVAVTRRTVKPMRAASDYIATGPSQFGAGVQPLLTQRTKEGLRGAFVDQEQLFDYYNYGRFGPAGIQKAVQSARPQYLLLLGRTTYDYRNYSGLNVDPLCPAFLVSTSFWAQATSDSMFGDLGRGYPEVAVGRLPINDVNELGVIVKRIVSYGGAPASGVRIHAVADRTDPTVDDFGAEIDGMANKCPDLTWQRNYLGTTFQTAPEVTAAMTDAANGGADWILYMGHGNSVRLGKDVPRILDNDRVQPWTGSAVFMQSTCTANWMAKNETGFKSIAIQALTQPQGGISASIASSTYMHSSAAAEFMTQLIQSTGGSSGRWGNALMKAQQWAYMKSGGNAAGSYYLDLSTTEQIFGDPAMPVYSKSRPKNPSPITPAPSTPQTGAPVGTF